MTCICLCSFSFHNFLQEEQNNSCIKLTYPQALEEHTLSAEREEHVRLDLAKRCRAKPNHFLLPEWGDKELPKDQWRLWCVNHLEYFIYSSSEPRWGAAGRLTAPVSELSAAIYRATPPRPRLLTCVCYRSSTSDHRPWRWAWSFKKLSCSGPPPALIVFTLINSRK